MILVSLKFRSQDVKATTCPLTDATVTLCDPLGVIFSDRMSLYGHCNSAAMAAAMVDLGGLGIKNWFGALILRRLIGASFVPAVDFDNGDFPYIQLLNASHLEI